MEEGYVCTLSNELLAIAKRDFGEDERIRSESLKIFRDWVKKQNYVKNCRTDSLFLLRFLRQKKFSVMRAQESFLTYFSAKIIFPFLTNHESHLTLMNFWLDEGSLFPLRERDAEGRAIIFHAPSPGALNLSAEDGLKILMVMAETISNCEELFVPGVVDVYDNKHVQMKHFSLINPKWIYFLAKATGKYTPTRSKKLVNINTNSSVVAVSNSLKSLFPEKYQKRVIMSTDESILKEMFPQHILPKEYGGQVPMKEFIDDWKKVVMEKKIYCKYYDEAILDENWETLRNNELLSGSIGIEGSFRKLNID